MAQKISFKEKIYWMRANNPALTPKQLAQMFYKTDNPTSKQWAIILSSWGEDHHFNLDLLAFDIIGTLNRQSIKMMRRPYLERALGCVKGSIALQLALQKLIDRGQVEVSRELNHSECIIRLVRSTSC